MYCMAAPRWASDKRPATGTDTNTAYGTVRPSGKFRPRIQIGGVTDFGKSGSEADFTPPDLPLQIKNCPSQRFYLGRSEKTVRVTSREHLPTVLVARAGSSPRKIPFEASLSCCWPHQPATMWPPRPSCARRRLLAGRPWVLRAHFGGLQLFMPPRPPQLQHII